MAESDDRPDGRRELNDAIRRMAGRDPGERSEREQPKFSDQIRERAQEGGRQQQEERSDGSD